MRAASKACFYGAVIVVALFVAHPLWRAKLDCMLYTPAWAFCLNPER